MASYQIEAVITGDSSVFNQAIANAIGSLDVFVEKIAEASTSISNFNTVCANSGGTESFISQASSILEVIGNVGSAIEAIEPISGAISTLATKLMDASGIAKLFSTAIGFITSPIGIVVLAITGLVALFAYLMATNEDFYNSIMSSFNTIKEALSPIMEKLGELISMIAGVIFEVIGAILQTVAPILAFIVEIIAQAISAIAPLIEGIISFIIMVISPIIDFISGICSKVKDIISFVLQNVQNIVSGAIQLTKDIITTLIAVFIGVFMKIWNAISPIIEWIKSGIANLVAGIKMGWNGLSSFASGVGQIIEKAASALVSALKVIGNGAIRGINFALGVINLIPGVNIAKIPYLLHGTDHWQGGLAVMNEGGRGEITYLPNGAQVIPHDISAKYAKEAARANANSNQSIDFGGILQGVTIQVISNSNFDGRAIKQDIYEYTIDNINRAQKNNLKAVGIYG